MKKTPGIKHSAPPVRKSFFGKYLPEFIVMGFVVLLYANSIPSNYNLDDELVTREHRLTSRGVSAIPEIFASPYYTDNAGYSYEYRPVVLASFAIEHQFFGDNPHVSHFFNLLFYALCCVVLYRVIYLFLPDRPRLLALGITLLFAAFPAHTEVVCSIKNRDDILSLLFSLLAAYAAYKTVSTNKNLYVVLVPVFFVLALISKTTIISFVVIIPVITIFFTRARFKQVMLICLLVLMPALFAIDFSFWHKLTGCVALISGLSLFYMVARSKTTLVLERITEVKKAFTTRPGAEENSIDLPGLRGIKSLFTNIKPGGVFSLKAAGVAVLGGAIYLTGVYAVFPAAVVSATLVLGFFIVWGDEPAWWWASVVLYGCLGFVCVRYSWNKTLYGELVSAVLLFQIFYGNRKLFIPVTIIFILISATGLQWGDFHILLNRLVGVVGFRIFGWPAIIWEAIPIHNFFKHPDQLPPTLFFTLNSIKLGGFFFTALIVSLIFRTGTRYLVGSFVVLAICVMFYFQTTEYNAISLKTAQSKLVSTVNMVNPRFIEIKQERPLDFVEQPVTNGETVALRAGTAFEVMCHYFIKTLVPYPMAYYYGYRYIKPEPITDPKPLAGLIIYLLLIVLAVALMHKNALLSMGLIIYLVSLTIFSGYFYPVPGQVADRFMLIPSIGWSILLGVAVFGTVKITSRSVVNQWRSVKNIVKAAFLALLLVYSAVTFARNFNWADDLTLFRHDISTVDESVQAHNILATHLIDHSLVANDPSEQKQLREEAIENFKKAADIRPSFFNATYDLGRVYLLLNMPDSALAWFIKANKINADFIEVQFYIADIYTQLGQYQAAIPYLEYTIRARPGDYAAYNKLSYVYFRLNDAYRSIEVSKQAILKTQAGGLPYAAIGSVYLSLNKPDSAGLWAHKALEIEPGNRGATQLLQRIGTR